ncbi:MAG: hypothetical protein AABX70_04375 [Nanoarchaeota archaeon]
MKSAVWLGMFLLILGNVLGYAASATPPGWGQEKGTDQPTLNCPSCYQTPSPRSGTVAKSGVTVKGTPYSNGYQVVVPTYSSFTYAPGWYVGLGNYYRHRGPFTVYGAQHKLGSEAGLNRVQEKNINTYRRGSAPSYQLVNGKMMVVK